MVSNIQELACDAEPADNEIVECNVLLAECIKRLEISVRISQAFRKVSSEAEAGA
jgi:hypothetical protein